MSVSFEAINLSRYAFVSDALLSDCIIITILDFSKLTRRTIWRSLDFRMTLAFKIQWYISVCYLFGRVYEWILNYKTPWVIDSESEVLASTSSHEIFISSQSANHKWNVLLVNLQFLAIFLKTTNLYIFISTFVALRKYTYK